MGDAANISEEVLDFLKQEQSPQYVAELMRYEFWNNLVLFLFSLLFFAGTFWLITKNYGFYEETEEQSESRCCRMWFGEEMLKSIIGWLTTLVMFVIAITLFNLTWFQIIVAPRVFLVTYIHEHLLK